MIPESEIEPANSASSAEVGGVNDLLERVARAKWAQRQKVAKANGLKLEDWEDELPSLRYEVRAETRAAIEAMLPITYEIDTAFREAFSELGPDVAPQDYWERAIDAALKGPAGVGG